MFRKKYLKITLCIVSVLLIGLLTLGCSGGGGQPTTQAPSLFDRVNALETQQRNSDANNSSLNSKVTTLESAIKNIPPATDITTAKNNAQSALDTAKQAQQTANDLKTQVTNDTNKITDLSNQIVAQKKLIDDLTAQVTALKTNPTPNPTTTPNPTSTTPANSLTASIIGNAFTGNTNMLIPAITNATPTNSAAFTIQLVNSTNKTLSGVQLAISLGIFDNTNPNNPIQYSLPLGTVNSLNSNGNLSIIWQSQDTGVSYVKGFVNQVNTGTFSFGNLVVPPGTSTYAQSFTVAQAAGSNALNITPSLIIIPSIKVLSQGT